MLELLDLGRRVYSSSEFEYQSVNMLYNGALDGLLEGPTWGAWWTQVRGSRAHARRCLPTSKRGSAWVFCTSNLPTLLISARCVAELIWNHNGLSAFHGGDDVARNAAFNGMVV